MRRLDISKICLVAEALEAFCRAYRTPIFACLIERRSAAKAEDERGVREPVDNRAPDAALELS